MPPRLMRARSWGVRPRLILAFAGVLVPYLALAGIGAAGFSLLWQRVDAMREKVVAGGGGARRPPPPRGRAPPRLRARHHPPPRGGGGGGGGGGGAPGGGGPPPPSPR